MLRLIRATRGDRVDGLETTSDLKKVKLQYLRKTKKLRSEQSWVWLQNGALKKETESLIVASHNQSIRTNLVKAKIDKNQKDTLWQLCKKADKSIDDVVSGCSKLAQKKYKRRHVNLSRKIHWKLVRKCSWR